MKLYIRVGEVANGHLPYFVPATSMPTGCPKTGFCG